MKQRKIRQAKAIENVFGSAHWHLNQRDLSIGELTEKLKNKTDNQEWIDTVIEDCIDKGYLKSDLNFAKSFIRNAVENGYRGTNWLKNKLKEKKVGEQAASQALDEAEYNYSSVALEYIERKFENGFKGKKREQVTRQLVSRGFSMSEAQYALSKCKHSDELLTGQNQSNSAIKKQKPAEVIILKHYNASKGLGYIKQQLSINGHKDVNLNEVIEKLELDFYESALKLAEKRVNSKRLDIRDYTDQNKLKSHLLGKGFSFDEVSYAIAEIKGE
ncbi:RecX family transcriptional regulator [Vibrio crassostreae]|uniref:RecX family transcriptional regulator n=1 Tax=Vibrio crassostreae TaxID=246167 RepID=UPI001B30484C|nr:RecX family transcriptional regulator [Vibrio crassostreae]